MKYALALMLLLTLLITISADSKTNSKTYSDKYLDSTSFSKEYSKTLTKTELPSLVNKTQSQLFSGKKYSETIREKITINPDFKFDFLEDTGFTLTPNQSGELVGYLGAKDFKYTVTFSKGLPLTNNTNQDYTNPANKFVSDATDNIQVPLFGEAYTLREVNASGENILIKLKKGNKTITLVDSKSYPYSENNNSENSDWVFDVGDIKQGTTPNVKVIKEFSIYNKNKKWDSIKPLCAPKDQALTPKCQNGSNEANFLEGVVATTPGYAFVKIIFNGFKKTGTTFTEFEITKGATLDNPYIIYADEEGYLQKIPSYILLYNKEGTFTVTDQTFYYKITEEPTEINGQKYAGYLQISKVPFETATNSDYLGDKYLGYKFYYLKITKPQDMLSESVSEPQESKLTKPIEIELIGAGTNNKSFEYRYYQTSIENSPIILMLSGGASKKISSYAFRIIGTDSDLGNSKVEDGINDQTFYVRDFEPMWGKALIDDTNYYVAKYDVSNSFEAISYFIDTKTGDPLALPNNNLGNYTHYLAYCKMKNNSCKTIWDSSKNKLGYLTAYSDGGASIKVVNEHLTLELPNKATPISITITNDNKKG